MKKLTVFKTFFTYTSREKKGILVLLFLILGVVSLQFLLPRFYSGKNSANVVQFKHQIDSLYASDSLVIRKKLTDTLPGTKIHLSSQVKLISPMEINQCDSQQLTTIPGIGPVLASRILKYRRLLGGYVDICQISEVYGLKEETFINIKKYLKLEHPMIRQIDVDTCNYITLLKHPYIGKDRAIKMMKFRSGHKEVGIHLEILEMSGIFDSIGWQKIKPYFIDRKNP